MNTIQELFAIGTGKVMPELFSPPDGMILNIKRNGRSIDGAINLALPGWHYRDGFRDFANNTIALIHAYDFMDRIDNIEFMLNEMKRVLKPHGVVNILSKLHKDTSSSILLDNSYYNNKLNIEVGLDIIIGFEKCAYSLKQLRKIK